MGKRRPRVAAQPEGDDLLDTSRPLGLRATLVSAGVLVALLLVAGMGIGYAVSPHSKVPAALSGCKTGPAISSRQFAAPPPMCIDVNKTYVAKVTTTQGTMGILIQPQYSPVTANNFIVLALSGYYTGCRFFHVDNNFLQTGDPENDGRGGPGYTLPQETNGPGFPIYSVGMARPLGGGPVNGSQFFILKNDWPLPGPAHVYNRFGIITSGNQVPSALTSNDYIISITVRPS